MSSLKGLPLAEIRQQLFGKALNHVNKLGWSDRVLTTAADELGYSGALATVAVPGGVYELIAHCMQDWEDRLRTDITAEKLAGQRKFERLKTVLEARFRYQIPYAAKWHEAICIGARPGNFPATSKRLLSTFDTVWELARNPIRDMSWYSRQAYLSYVFLSTEQQLLRDSDDYATTWRFLEHQLSTAHTYPQYASNVVSSQAALMTKTALEALWSLRDYVRPEPTHVEKPFK